MTSMDLHGKTAIVTGASRGIGLVTAQALAAAGANVVLTSRKQEAADEAAAQIAGPQSRRRRTYRVTRSSPRGR